MTPDGRAQRPHHAPQLQQSASMPDDAACNPFRTIGIPAVAAAADQLRRRAQQEKSLRPQGQLPPGVRDIEEA